MADTFAYCLKHGILGVGWRVDEIGATKDWDTFYKIATNVYDNLRACTYIRNRVHEGDLVWTRDTQGNYYLARVLSGWEYFTTEGSQGKGSGVDIGNVFRVAFELVTIDEVPGKVVACFRPRRTIQAIRDSTVITYTKFLWNQRAKKAIYEFDRTLVDNTDIFSLLDSEEVEDLVFLYLQWKNWYVVPNSRKADTMAFEYEVICPKTGGHAQVQVKTGYTSLNLEKYKNSTFRVILFQSNDLYCGKLTPNVTCISRNELENFLKRAEWLPARYRNKMNMLNTLDRKRSNSTNESNREVMSIP
ncbi:hypothetical protein [Acetobacter sp.]|uniref:hypothetical protein n=1 Tax=Acetobacter sp. TaxID=440 RepID=UPI00258FD2D0|nr:hypothetical protein [Acetobacter sp.]MCC6105743.1 hypothetical protein [Acetobacter sp.]